MEGTVQCRRDAVSSHDLVSKSTGLLSNLKKGGFLQMGDPKSPFCPSTARMRFLITKKLTFEKQMPSGAAALFAEVQDQKTPPEKTLTVSWNAGSDCAEHVPRYVTDPTALFRAVYDEKVPFKSMETYQIEAKDEADAYHEMVLKDHAFNLENLLYLWQLWTKHGGLAPERSLLWTVFVQLDSTLQTQLNTLDPCLLGAKDADAQPVLAEIHPLLENRKWITPSVAKQLWLIYNDPRDLLIGATYGSAAGIHCADPFESREYAQLTPLSDVSLKVL
jgi:hypothetical protein